MGESAEYDQMLTGRIRNEIIRVPSNPVSNKSFRNFFLR